MFYIYILYSKTMDRYYVGHSDNVQRRVDEHNNPKRLNKYTAKTSDWELAASFPIGKSRSEAMLVERYIKKQKSRPFIEKIIVAANNPSELAQLVRVPTCRD